MRLIDLDQKIIVPIEDERAETSYEVQMTVAELFDKFLEGNKPEIVEAVPVEWLKGLMLSTEDDVDKVEFAWIMREWESEQKEQEAQDGNI